jgi:kynurenine formamidase/2-keto-3-deoxy-L-rhamnonate aldolase RhmA
MSGSPLRHRIGQREPIGLFWMMLGSSAVLEVAVHSKPDAVVIDAQHGLWDRASLEESVGVVMRAAPVLVRVAENSPVAIGQALDAGAEGVIVPLIETDVEAAAAVAAARFPPEGTRSGGGVRPLSGNFGQYYLDQIRRTVVGVMIETVRGVRNAAAIANTPGVDFVLIGTGDLAISLGGFPHVDARHGEACMAVFQACKMAGVACGIFTRDVQAAIASRKDGYPIVVVANDVDVVSGGFTRAMNAFTGKTSEMVGSETVKSAAKSSAAPVGYLSADSDDEDDNVSNLLLKFASFIADGRIRVVDMTQTLKPSTPVIQLPPPLAQSDPFSIAEISKYDDRGPGWYWNNIACGEHTGTHFDAPAHWVTGKHYPDGYTDTVSVQRFIAPAVVIDCSKEAAANEKFLMEPSHIEAWEARHGRIPDGSWVLMRTDWSKRDDPARFLNMKEDGPHVPGPSAAAVRFLVQQRNVNGFGVEAVGTDAGQAFAFEPAFPAHHLMHGANKFGLASLCNLDQLPARGAILVTTPLKIEKGSGSPLRVIALVPAA